MPAGTFAPSRPASRRPRSGGGFKGKSFGNGSRGGGPRGGGGKGKPPPTEADHEILFQQYFKSVGPRTYAAQVKRAANGNHYVVLTEGKRDAATGEVRKCRVFVYSEDFIEFFRLIKATAEFVKANPVPEEVKRKRDAFWTKQNGGQPAPAVPVPGRPAPAAAASAGAVTRLAVR